MADAHQRRVVRRAADQIAKKITQIQIVGEGSWKRLVDNPKLCLAVGFISVAATLSGKISAMGAWICLALAWPLLSGWIAGLSAIKQSFQKKRWVGLLAIGFGIALFLFGRFLVPSINPRSPI